MRGRRRRGARLRCGHRRRRQLGLLRLRHEDRPAGRRHDGLLDVVVIEAASRRALIRALPKVYDGGHVALAEVHVLRGRSVAVSGTPSVPMGGDGEPLGHLPASSDDPARIDVVPGALRILLPATGTR